jgi:hypothetical protein
MRVRVTKLEDIQSDEETTSTDSVGSEFSIRAGIGRNQDRGTPGSPSDSGSPAQSRTRIFMGGRLLVSVEQSIRLA